MIYQTVCDKIRRMVEKDLVNPQDAAPLKGVFSSVDEAKTAYLNRHQAFEDSQFSISFLLSIVAPYFCCCAYLFLDETQRYNASLRRRFFAAESEKNAAMAYARFSSQQKVTVQEGTALETLEKTIASLHHHVHNCISIAGLVVLELHAHGIAMNKIEIFQKIITSDTHDADAHAFVVVDRCKDSDSNDMRTWGKDCYIIDPWYNICTSAPELSQNQNRFNYYPLLLSLNDKKPVPCKYSDAMLKSYTERANQWLPDNDKIALGKKIR